MIIGRGTPYRTTKEKAQLVADQLSQHDKDWAYVVKPSGSGLYVVEIYCEENEYVATFSKEGNR